MRGPWVKTGLCSSVLVLLAWTVTAGAAEPGFSALAYHDVRDRVARDLDADQYVVSTANLIAHFTWLRANGYTPVSVDDILAARDGLRPLPEKAVLLSFDDGLKSVYTHVYPLLQLFDYPAVVSVVTSWIESGAAVDYGGRKLGRGDFLSWRELAEMQESGRVEIAAHSHDLHRGIPGNPQGNLQPAAVTRWYAGDEYESEAVYRARISADLERNAKAIAEHTGRAPRVLTWPYGVYNAVGLELAARHGMPVTLTLDTGANTPDGTSRVKRHAMVANPGVREFSTLFVREPRPTIVRAAQVDLDYVFDEDPAQQEANLGKLLDRIKALEISHVFLQAFADPDGDGGADQVYFPSRHLPMRADLFNRVAWQLRMRADVQVFAWLPMLSFTGEGFDSSWRVMEDRDGEVRPSTDGEPRLSPFHPDARSRIVDIYRELAVHASFSGLLFHDDGRLNEYEDANPAALAVYRQILGTDFSLEGARADRELAQRWTAIKSEALIDLTRDVTAAVREHRPAVKTARNLFSSALLDEAGELYLAQDYDAYLAAYDYVALMAMPYLENAPDEERFYLQLVEAVRARPVGIEQTIFELQTVDWRHQTPIPASKLRHTMRWLQSLGVRHLGYYPDDFIHDHPEFELLRQGISLAEYPKGDG